MNDQTPFHLPCSDPLKRIIREVANEFGLPIPTLFNIPDSRRFTPRSIARGIAIARIAETCGWWEGKYPRSGNHEGLSLFQIAKIFSVTRSTALRAIRLHKAGRLTLDLAKPSDALLASWGNPQARARRTAALKAYWNANAAKRRKTHCQWGHPLDASNAYTEPNGNRHCKICRKNGDKIRRLKRRTEKILEYDMIRGKIQ